MLTHKNSIWLHIGTYAHKYKPMHNHGMNANLQISWNECKSSNTRPNPNTLIGKIILTFPNLWVSKKENITISSLSSANFEYIYSLHYRAQGENRTLGAKSRLRVYYFLSYEFKAKHAFNYAIQNACIKTITNRATCTLLMWAQAI